MSRSALLYTDGYRARSRALKRAGRCRACRRRRRMRALQVWRPRQLDTHHTRRAPGARLVVLCHRPCHMDFVHGLDRHSPFPLVVDTWLAIVLVRLALVVAWAIAIASVVLTWRYL